MYCGLCGCLCTSAPWNCGGSSPLGPSSNMPSILYPQDWALFEGLLRAKVAQHYFQAEVAQHVMEKASTTCSMEEIRARQGEGAAAAHSKRTSSKKKIQSILRLSPIPTDCKQTQKSKMKRAIIPFVLAIGASSSVSAFAPSRQAEVSLSPIRSGKCGGDM